MRSSLRAATSFSVRFCHGLPAPAPTRLPAGPAVLPRPAVPVLPSPAGARHDPAEQQQRGGRAVSARRLAGTYVCVSASCLCVCLCVRDGREKSIHGLKNRNSYYGICFWYSYVHIPERWLSACSRCTPRTWSGRVPTISSTASSPSSVPGGSSFGSSSVASTAVEGLGSISLWWGQEEANFELYLPTHTTCLVITDYFTSELMIDVF